MGSKNHWNCSPDLSTKRSAPVSFFTTAGTLAPVPGVKGLEVGPRGPGPLRYTCRVRGTGADPLLDPDPPLERRAGTPNLSP